MSVTTPTFAGTSLAKHLRDDVDRQSPHDFIHGAIYDETSDTTYFAYPKSNVPYVVAYDHAAQSWSGPVKIGTATEDHGAPSLFMDANGILHVGWGGHGSDLLHARSDSARDISSWTTQVIESASSKTYTGFVEDDSGTLYLLIGQENFNPTTPGYYTSTDGGSTWSTYTVILDMTVGTWPTRWQYDSTQNRIYWCLETQDDNKNWTGIYFFYHDLGDGNLYALDGHNFGTQITNETDYRNHAVVTEGNPTDGITAPGGAFEFSSSGEPYIPYVYADNNSNNVTDNDSYHHSIAWWDSGNSTWQTTTDIQLADQRNDAGSIRFVTDDHIRWFLPNNEGDDSLRGGDIEVWETMDAGATWSKTQTILTVQQDVDGKNLHAPIVPKNAKDDLEIFFCSWNSNSGTASEQLYAWGGGSGFHVDEPRDPRVLPASFNGSTLGIDSTGLLAAWGAKDPSASVFYDNNGGIHASNNASIVNDSTLSAAVASFGGTSDYLGSTTVDWSTVDDASILLLARLDDVSSNQVLFSYYKDGSNRVHIGYNSTADALWIRVEVAGTVTEALWDDWSPTTGQYYVIEAHFGTNGNLSGRVNGNNLSSNAGSTTTSSFQDVGVGTLDFGRRGDAVQYWNGRYALGLAYSRILPQAESQGLTDKLLP